VEDFQAGCELAEQPSRSSTSKEYGLPYQYLGTTNLNRSRYSPSTLPAAQLACVRGSALWSAVELGIPPLMSQQQAALVP
jgi:hypothetical protein